MTHLQILVPRELSPGAPLCSPAPISLSRWGRTNLERLPQHTHLVRLCGGVAMPLARLTEGTGTNETHADYYASAPIGLCALLLWDQLLVGGTLQYFLWLEHKMLAADSAIVPGFSQVRGSRARRGSCVWGGGMAAAHVVGRPESGRRWCSHTRRRGETHGDRTCQEPCPHALCCTSNRDSVPGPHRKALARSVPQCTDHATTSEAVPAHVTLTGCFFFLAE